MVRMKQKKNLKKSRCLYCGKSFYETKLNQKHCSLACRIKFSNERRKTRGRKRDVLRKFGMSLEDYKKLLYKQKNVCAICGRYESYKNSDGKTIRGLCVDHNHVKRKNRGLLCSKCNVGLGYFSEDPEKLKKAIQYLKRWNND